MDQLTCTSLFPTPTILVYDTDRGHVRHGKVCTVFLTWEYLYQFVVFRQKNPASMCVHVCVVILFILDVRFVDVPAGVTQERDHTGFVHLPSAVLALIFLRRRIHPFLSLVDREVEFCVLTI